MKKMNSDFQYAGTSEAAKLIGVTQPYIRQLLGKKKLRGQRVGRAWAIPLLEIQRFLGEEKRAGRPRSGQSATACG
jgi:excisionase family DNA binding protein